MHAIIIDQAVYVICSLYKLTKTLNNKQNLSIETTIKSAWYNYNTFDSKVSLQTKKGQCLKKIH